MIEIRVPARVHAGLIELSAGGYRTNGGIGWALESPELIVTASPADAISIEDGRDSSLGGDELALLTSELSNVAARENLGGARIRIEGDLIAHRGLGGGTALRLAAIECLMTLAGRELAPAHLVRVSGRGGTSGVGIHTYFDGGLSFDLGHPGSVMPRPSRDRTKEGPPLPLLQLNMPDWPLGILSPSWLPIISTEEERQLFRDTRSIGQAAARDTLYHMIFGLIAAVSEVDVETFAAATDALQSVSWKQREWAVHGHQLRDAATDLRKAGARGVGLSSIGPTLFFLAQDLDISLLTDQMASAVSITKPSNHGRTLRVLGNA